MAGGLLQEVGEDPTEVDHRFGSDVVAALIEPRRVGDCAISVHAERYARTTESMESSYSIASEGRVISLPANRRPSHSSSALVRCLTIQSRLVPLVLLHPPIAAASGLPWPDGSHRRRHLSRHDGLAVVRRGSGATVSVSER
jgi:hypothetical protein